MSALARKDLWGGRFREGQAESFRKLNDSLSFDRALLEADVRASAAWAGALEKAGVLSKTEGRRIRTALKGIFAEARAGGAPPAGFEDVHSFLEAKLAARVGAATAARLGTGRSRNDLVATDLRLYLKDAAAQARDLTLDLSDALARRAAAEAATPLPGYTHLQRALPVTFGHWCLAFVEMLLRDADRWMSLLARGDECPLGSGALAGTPLPIDRAALARELGFARASANSLDAVSDRDTAAEYLFTASLLLVHLSRLAEDLILFGSEEFGFARLPDSLATGSSRMPHKKNPDLLELLRGHAGRSIGELAGLLAVLKGIPLAYDKDLQLDKEPVFRTRELLGSALPALTMLIERLALDRARMREAASDPRLLATEVADAMAARGVPFRQAHEMVGRRIAQAESAGLSFEQLPPGGGVTAEDLTAMSLDRALRRRSAFGGTAPNRVRRAAAAAERRIKRMRKE